MTHDQIIKNVISMRKLDIQRRLNTYAQALTPKKTRTSTHAQAHTQIDIRLIKIKFPTRF